MREAEEGERDGTWEQAQLLMTEKVLETCLKIRAHQNPLLHWSADGVRSKWYPLINFFPRALLVPLFAMPVPRKVVFRNFLSRSKWTTKFRTRNPKIFLSRSSKRLEKRGLHSKINEYTESRRFYAKKRLHSSWRLVDKMFGGGLRRSHEVEYSFELAVLVDDLLP